MDKEAETAIASGMVGGATLFDRLSEAHGHLRSLGYAVGHAAGMALDGWPCSYGGVNVTGDDIAVMLWGPGKSFATVRVPLSGKRQIVVNVWASPDERPISSLTSGPVVDAVIAVLDAA